MFLSSRLSKPYNKIEPKHPPIESKRVSLITTDEDKEAYRKSKFDALVATPFPEMGYNVHYATLRDPFHLWLVVCNKQDKYPHSDTDLMRAQHLYEIFQLVLGRNPPSIVVAYLGSNDWNTDEQEKRESEQKSSGLTRREFAKRKRQQNVEAMREEEKIQKKVEATPGFLFGTYLQSASDPDLAEHVYYLRRDPLIGHGYGVRDIPESYYQLLLGPTDEEELERENKRQRCAYDHNDPDGRIQHEASMLAAQGRVYHTPQPGFGHINGSTISQRFPSTLHGNSTYWP